MTQAAVSYQIKLLEDRVGGPLFLRGARGVTLTRDRPPARARRSPRRLRSSEVPSRNCSETAENILRITALNTFATNWLVPRLGGFQLAHPGIAVQARRLQRRWSISRARMSTSAFAAAAGHGRASWRTGCSPAAFTPMLSPRLLEQVRAARYACRSLEAAADRSDRRLVADWFAEAGVPAPDLSNRDGIRVLNQQLAGRAALAGQGVAILMPAFFADELASGRLVQPFPIVRRSSEKHYWLVYPEARRRSPKIRAFRDWILCRGRRSEAT